MLSSSLALVILAATARPVEPPTRQCAAVVVSSAEAPGVRNKFSARKILDVQFTATLRSRVAGSHVLSFRVYTPKGHLYQELRVPFDAGAPGGDATGRRIRLPRLATRMPVGGTSITNASLYGKWKVVPHLDGSTRACGAHTAFTIAQ